MSPCWYYHGIFEEVNSKGIGKLGGDDVDTAPGKVLGDRFQEKTGYDILNSPYKQQFMLAVEPTRSTCRTIKSRWRVWRRSCPNAI